MDAKSQGRRKKIIGILEFISQGKIASPSVGTLGGK